MAQTVYGEARSQPYAGQLAVAWVIRTRADHPGWWGSSVRDVCMRPFQFSCWNVDDPNRGVIVNASLEIHAFRSAYRAALGAYDRSEPDPTHGATHYHTISVPKGANTWPPKWAASMVPTAVVGDHRFLREA